LTVIVNGQHRVWYIVLQPLAFVIFFVASLAEVGRAPFDIPMAESEVVGGPFVEYSGMHWAMFFLAEYANTFALAVLATLLFLGGWHGWAPSHGVGQEVVQALWLLLKTSLVIMLVFWVRATVPRLRIDQLMSLAWKVLLPLAFVNFVLTAFYKFYGWPSWTIAVMSIAVLGAVLYAYHRRRFTRAARPVTIKLRVEHGRIVR
ncbi:MAG: NADH-quinone oxidoreductase subunit H, partial [Chloroflexi bacterium]|nr:NADH-quinone oxidoreductase subunit H [Chloroflexota bacterium]